MEINYTWLIASCTISILLVVIYFYWKISDKIDFFNSNILDKMNSENKELKGKLIALKRFRDFESKGQQKYNSMLLSVLDHIFTTANIWKKGEATEFQKLQGKFLDELIEEKITEYNNFFKEEKEYKREP